MSNIQVFNNPQFGEIRTSGDAKKPYFCLADICRALDLEQPFKVKQRLRERGITTVPTLTSGGTQNMLFVDEPNLYRCVFQSRKKEAEIFQDWVFEEILPTIRKQGGYGVAKELSDAEMVSRTFVILQRQLDELKSQNENLKSQLRLLRTHAARKRMKSTADNNSIEEFLEYIGIQPATDGEGKWVSMRELMDSYDIFCKTEKKASVSSKRIGRTLKSKGYERQHKRDGSWYLIAVKMF